MHDSKILAWIARTMIVAAWAPISVVVLHIVCAVCFDAYTRFPEIDIPMHFLGGVAIAYFFHAASRIGSECHVLGPYHAVSHAGLVFGFTCVAAVFWEFFEFVADHYLQTRSQDGDLNDTLLDLLMGLFGGTALIVFLGLIGCLRPTDGVRVPK